MRLKYLWPLVILAACGCSRPAEEAVPELRFNGFLESLEIAPLLLAVDRHYPHAISLGRGGIANLVGAVTTNYGDTGVADVASNAETQLLRHSVDNPGLRVIMTITEGQYRIIARRSAGIQRLADLAGKRVGTMPGTSAAYFLDRMLASVQLQSDDVVLVGDIDLPDFSAALADGRIDALAMWSPQAEEAGLALGPEAIAFDGEGIYREIFNLNTTEAVLADPAKRAAIKELLRALVAAGEEMDRDPRAAQQLVAARMSDYPSSLVEAAWPHHRYIVGKVPDLVDELVLQEQWLAGEARLPRDRQQLAQLVDYSLLDEVLAERR